MLVKGDHKTILHSGKRGSERAVDVAFYLVGAIRKVNDHIPAFFDDLHA